MIPLADLMILLLITMVLAITPGPDNLYVLSQSALYRWQTGVIITLGLCTGLILHTLAIGLGITAAIMASPWLFDSIRYGGALYLAYLALQAFRTGQLAITAQRAQEQPPLKLYRRGILMNISNPKVALFFLAFLPQFVDLQQGKMGMQLLQIGTVFILVTFVVFSSYAILSKPLQRYLTAHPQRQRQFHQLTGILLLMLAIHIAVFNG